MLKNLLIIFPDEHLSYSPTVLNLVSILSRYFSITVIAAGKGILANQILEGQNFKFIKTRILLNRLLGKLGFEDLYIKIHLFLFFQGVKNYKKNNPQIDEVIAVDSAGLWIAQKLFGNCHFLSLEIKKDSYFEKTITAPIKSIVIQTEERLKFLLHNVEKPWPKSFFIQNSPILENKYEQRKHKQNFNGKLIYLGSVIPAHGIYTLLDFLESSTLQDITLTIKGSVSKQFRKHIERRYIKLLQSQLIFIDETYIKQKDVTDFLSEYCLGFCLYDFNFIDSDDFNYISCPSGKLFNYYAAGIPVIGSEILGLSSIKTFNTGILLPQDKLRLKEIEYAIQEIERNFLSFSENCLAASRYFNFKEMAKPYVKYLRN